MHSSAEEKGAPSCGASRKRFTVVLALVDNFFENFSGMGGKYCDGRRKDTDRDPQRLGNFVITVSLNRVDRCTLQVWNYG
jgi:hypothetical protein